MEPPIIEIKVKKGKNVVTLGGEKVIYRHDETYYNPSALCIELPYDLGREEMENEISKIHNLFFKRAGSILRADMTAIRDYDKDAGFPQRALDLIKLSPYPTLICTENFQSVELILNFAEKEGIILMTSLQNVLKLSEKLKNEGIPTAVAVSCFEEAKATGEALRSCGIKKGLIALTNCNDREMANTLYNIRLRALFGKERALGFPVLVFPEKNKQSFPAVLSAMIKYASAIVTRDTDPAHVLALLTLRQNIFTDPRRPIQVEAKVYNIAEAGADSPVLITTNFSLTYFTVSQEIEASGVPTHLLVIDTGGTSVLTAWSADRLNAQAVIKAAESTGIEKIVTHRKIIIPGYVPELKEELENKSSFEVIVGPKEASDIPGFLRGLSK